MTVWKPVRTKDIVMGKLGFGSDLLEELTNLSMERGVRLGRIEAMGAVQKARIAFYDQKTRIYQYLLFDQPFEITQLIGNVSIKDGQPFVHAHVTLADETGKCIGGHLASGTKVFACEFLLEAFEGPDFNRRLDEDTGLPLWLF